MKTPGPDDHSAFFDRVYRYLGRLESQGRGALHLEPVFYHYAFIATFTTR